jgi:hypothetical protein
LCTRGDPIGLAPMVKEIEWLIPAAIYADPIRLAGW